MTDADALVLSLRIVMVAVVFLGTISLVVLTRAGGKSSKSKSIIGLLVEIIKRSR